jgi:hypothetical protein
LSAGDLSGHAAVALSGANFAGSINATDASGITGTLNGSFFSAPGMRAAYQGGSVVATGPGNYRLSGTFEAQRRVGRWSMKHALEDDSSTEGRPRT